MQINANKLDNANASFSTNVETKELDAKVAELAKKQVKNVTIAGFRKGKAPVEEVLKRYGAELKNDVRNELFAEIITKGVKLVDKEEKDVIGQPFLSKFEEKDGKTEIEIEVSFRPEVDVTGYEECIPAFDYPTTNQEEIEQEKAAILYNVAPLVYVDKPNGIELGDIAEIDFNGTIDGEGFEGGSASNFRVLLGSNALIPGFEDGVVGMKIGESKNISLTFPADYQATALANKNAVFAVTLKGIVNKAGLELNDEVLKQFLPNEAAPSVEKFEDVVKRTIIAAKLQNLINTELKAKLSEALVAKFNFDLPKNIVEQEMNVRLNQSFASFSEEERKEVSENRLAALNKREEFRQAAQESVKLTFIIDKLAQVRNVVVSDNDVINAVAIEAQQNGIDPRSHLQECQNRGILPIIKMAMVENRVMLSLFQKAE